MSAFPCNTSGRVPQDFSAKSIAGKTASFEEVKANAIRVGRLCVDQIIGSECCDETTAIVTSSNISIFNPPDPPVIDTMQNVAIDQFLFGFPSQFAQFDLPIFDNAGLWDNTLKAFRIQEAGRYLVSFEVTLGLIPTVPPPGTVYPDAYSGIISIRDSLDNPKLALAGDVQSGTPTSLTADGLGIIPVKETSIVELEVGDLVRVVLKAVKNAAPAVTGTVVAAGQIMTTIPGEGSTLIRSSQFSINKLSKE